MDPATFAALQNFLPGQGQQSGQDFTKLLGFFAQEMQLFFGHIQSSVKHFQETGELPHSLFTGRSRERSLDSLHGRVIRWSSTCPRHQAWASTQNFLHRVLPRFIKNKQLVAHVCVPFLLVKSPSLCAHAAKAVREVEKKAAAGEKKKDKVKRKPTGTVRRGASVSLSTRRSSRQAHPPSSACSTPLGQAFLSSLAVFNLPQHSCPLLIA